MTMPDAPITATVQQPRAARPAAPRVSLQKCFDACPPFSDESEMSLLGSMILDPRVVGEVVDASITPESFYKQSHAVIYEAIVRIADKGGTFDLVQLMEAIRDKDLLDDVGGQGYLLSLAESVPAAVNWPYYARRVRELSDLRRMIDASGQTLFECYHPGLYEDQGGVTAIIDRAERRVYEVSDAATAASKAVAEESLGTVLSRRLDEIDASTGGVLTGVTTGLLDLDEMLGGWQRGDMIIVGARPSMGKTALGLQAAVAAARAGVPVGVLSLEMSRAAVAERMLCSEGRIDGTRLRRKFLSDEEWRKVSLTGGELFALPIFIDDQPGLTLMQARSRGRRLRARHDIGLLVIDYLQLMSEPSASRENRQTEVSAISRGLKALARELNIPVLVLAQLNRNVEGRSDLRPRMSDLRESGSIEQDADVIILLHREEYYHKADPTWAQDNPDKVGVADLIVDKQRMGATGVVKTVWESSSTRFLDHAKAGYR